MGMIYINAKSKRAAVSSAKLDDHLGSNIRIKKIVIKRKPRTKGYTEGIYEIYYERR